MIFIDSDSNDGTKKELERFSIDKNFVTYVELNGLEAKYKNRIERIALSRNACLNIITKNYNLNNVIYIPLDLDINLFKFTKISISDVSNLSINETLARTIITSMTTLLALFSIYILGGEILRGFSFAMILGVLIGTYSSIFVASPILKFFKVSYKTLEKEEEKIVP